jgi:hypothetical protein
MQKCITEELFYLNFITNVCQVFLEKFSSCSFNNEDVVGFHVCISEVYFVAQLIWEESSEISSS